MTEQTRNAVWQWVSACLFAVAFGLCGYIGGQQSLAKTVDVNSNRLTAIETIIGTLNPTLTEIKGQLKEINQNLNTHIMSEQSNGR